MKKVTGLGGIFFKVNDPSKTREWYKQHLGIESESWGAQFNWRPMNEPQKTASSAWNPFAKNSSYFDPSTQPFMINYRVENLVALLEILKAEGIEIVGEMVNDDYGKFAWIMDPDGNKIELWEPKED